MGRMATTSTEQAATQWEYKIWSEGLRARLDDRRLERELNELGAQGWEVCARSGDNYVLKRPVR